MSLPRFSVNNPVLVNLLMVGLIVGGVYYGFTLVREIFPETDPDQILITTEYFGATPSEIEKGITIKVEQAIKDIEDIDTIDSVITEGLSSVLISLRSETEDVNVVLDEVKIAVDSIDDFPEAAERTETRKYEPKWPVIAVAVYGEIGERGLKEISLEVRDELLALPGITDVSLGGVRQDEIAVEVEPDKLVQYGLSLPMIADAVRRGNLDLPAGQIKTEQSNVAVRTLGEQDQADAIGQIIVRSSAQGEVLRLKDVAGVIDGFEETEIETRVQGRPAVILTAFKTRNQDAIDIGRKIKAYVAGKSGAALPLDFWTRVRTVLAGTTQYEGIYQAAAREPLPAGIGMTTTNNLSRFIEDRLDLLKRNGRWGLMFVVLSLLLFLSWRVAFWIALGLVLSIAGTLIFMGQVGITLNLLTMFGLIVVLGLITDDAIVVGENVYAYMESGLGPREAAVRGAEEVTWPVIATVVTTVFAFLPLALIEGRLGTFMRVLPMVAACALAVSLLEALTILPCHLASTLHVNAAEQGAGQSKGKFRRALRLLELPRRFLLDRVVPAGYIPFLRKAVSWRYVTVATAFAGLVVIWGVGPALFGGSDRVPFTFLQKEDSEIIICSVEMPVGTPIDHTKEVIAQIERRALSFAEVQTVQAFAGLGYEEDFDDALPRGHIGQLVFELKPVEQRTVTSEEIMDRMRSTTDRIVGPNSIRYLALQGGPGGLPIAIEVAGRQLDEIAAVAEAVKEKLRTFEGMQDIVDDFDEGRREVQLELLDSGRALGLTTESLGTQVRGAFYGLEAQVLQREREDLRVMVRFPRQHRQNVYDLEQMWVTCPSGHLVPLREVARVKEGTGYTTLRRTDERRAITIRADVDENVNRPEVVLDQMQPWFAQLQDDHAGLLITPKGRSREANKSLGSLRVGFTVALVLIYITLAWLFGSYIQPLIVMLSIPLSLIGVIAGHWLLGYPLTILSLIGTVALAGIAVNDALILVCFANRRRQEGTRAFEAVIEAGRRRLRPVLLTTMTTCLGLAPLMFETSFQARFLIPMAVAIVFGLISCTFLTLLVIPCTYMIAEDAKWLLRRLWHGPAMPAPATA